MDRRVVDSYVVEILARARATAARCREVTSNAYVSPTPRALGEVLLRISLYLERAVGAIYLQCEWAPDGTLRAEDAAILRNTDLLLRMLFAHLRYVEGATTARLPWSIVGAFEHLVEEALPSAQVMLRPQWKYNYATIISDLRAFYRNLLEEYQDFVVGPEPLDPLKEVLDPLPRSFHIISFPALERTNILLHTVLGHELGHIASEPFVADEARRTAFVNGIIPNLTILADQELKAPKRMYGPLFETHVKDQMIQDNAETAEYIWKRALQELLSDVVGAILFGPAALFSTFEMAISRGFDEAPSPANDYYAPWRMRLRVVTETLERVSPGFFPIPKAMFREGDVTPKVNTLDAHYAKIKAEIAKTDDVAAIKRSPITDLCYQELPRYIDEGTSYLLTQGGLQRFALRPEALAEKGPHLVERLASGLPPNAVEVDVLNPQPVTMAEIINAAWYYRLTCDGGPPIGPDGSVDESRLKTRRNTNLLTLKAIEYSDLARQFACASAETTKAADRQ